MSCFVVFFLWKLFKNTIKLAVIWMPAFWGLFREILCVVVKWQKMIGLNWNLTNNKAKTKKTKKKTRQKETSVTNYSLFLPSCDSPGFKFFSTTMATYSQRYDHLFVTAIFVAAAEGPYIQFDLSKPAISKTKATAFKARPNCQVTSWQRPVNQQLTSDGKGHETWSILRAVGLCLCLVSVLLTYLYCVTYLFFR